MSTLTLKILDDRDEEFVMNILVALAKKRIIEVPTRDPFLMPGTPMTEEQLSARVNEARQTRPLSVEEVKTRLGL